MCSGGMPFMNISFIKYSLMNIFAILLKWKAHRKWLCPYVTPVRLHWTHQMAFYSSVVNSIRILSGIMLSEIHFFLFWKKHIFQSFSDFIFIPCRSQCNQQLQPHFLSPHPSIAPHCSPPFAHSTEYIACYKAVCHSFSLNLLKRSQHFLYCKR